MTPALSNSGRRPLLLLPRMFQIFGVTHNQGMLGYSSVLCLPPSHESESFNIEFICKYFPSLKEKRMKSIEMEFTPVAMSQRPPVTSVQEEPPQAIEKLKVLAECHPEIQELCGRGESRAFPQKATFCAFAVGGLLWSLLTALV